MNFRRQKEKKVEPYVIEKCLHCGKDKKRKFKDGDFLFLQTDSCQSCNQGSMHIEMIFGEPIVEKK